MLFVSNKTTREIVVLTHKNKGSSCWFSIFPGHGKLPRFVMVSLEQYIYNHNVLTGIVHEKVSSTLINQIVISEYNVEQDILSQDATHSCAFRINPSPAHISPSLGSGGERICGCLEMDAPDLWPLAISMKKAMINNQSFLKIRGFPRVSHHSQRKSFYRFLR